MVPKITDFGLSRPVEISQTMTTNIFATPGYGAPELYGHGTMSVKLDIYSLGAIIIELVTGQKGVHDNDNNILRKWRHRWNKSAKETPPEYHHQVNECLEIGKLCLNPDPNTRPFISQIMNRFVEMESTKINPLNWEDDMLGVEPLELQFGYNKEQKLSCSVELSNDTDGSIAFKIETTSHLPYSIEPNKDIVKPRSKFFVDITLPFASIQDYKAALQYRSINQQYFKEIIVQSFKVNEGLTTKDINKNMFGKQTEGHHVDEIYLVVVSEESCSEEAIGSRSKQAKKQYTSSGSRPTPIKPGTVQLVMRNTKNTPLLEYKQKVMLELTGGYYTRDRPGLDLVVVLDTGASGEQHIKKMAELKIAMRFIIQKLSPIDRLSVVTFSRTATELYPLRPMTRASKHELQGLVDLLDSFGGTSNIEEGLLTGLKVLTKRKVSGDRIIGIMLMSDGMEKGDATRVSVGNVPVYTFGFGGNCNSWALSRIAGKSKGGTFSQIKKIGGGGLTKAFSQCLAGLLTVSVRDLELTVAAVAGKSTILKVNAGSYPQTNNGESATVSFSNLYSREVRKVIVELLLPAIQSECNVEVLKVTYSYSKSSSDGKVQFVAPPERLIVWRTGVEVLEEMLPELHNEELRVKTAKMIKETTTPLSPWASEDKLHEAQESLVEAQNMLDDMLEKQLFKAELQELIELYETRFAYQHEGRHYRFSLNSSHDRQRFASRGDIRLFATPLMDKYVEQAKKFHDNPRMQLPSVDDDTNEEVTDLTVIAARREEEIQRLRLDIED